MRADPRITETRPRAPTGVRELRKLGLRSQLPSTLDGVVVVVVLKHNGGINTISVIHQLCWGFSNYGPWTLCDPRGLTKGAARFCLHIMRCEETNIECFNILQNLVMCNNSVTKCLSSRGPRVVLNAFSISADSVNQDTIISPHLFLVTRLRVKP